ncbi:MAG: 30S ribosomal protein S8 [bacterium]
MVNDPIADLLTRLRNAILRTNKEVAVPASQKLEAIAKILKEEGYIEDFSVETVLGEKQNNIVMKMRYLEHNKPIIHHLERVSRPGLRIYQGYREIKPILNGLGINIFSTSAGIMSGKKAITEKIGGEYLCKIW